MSNKNISVDESMIPFKGRLQFKQRMPLKPVKYGIKLFEVCESKTGYCMKFSVYLGKQGEMMTMVVTSVKLEKWLSIS